MSPGCRCADGSPTGIGISPRTLGRGPRVPRRRRRVLGDAAGACNDSRSTPSEAPSSALLQLFATRHDLRPDARREIRSRTGPSSSSRTARATSTPGTRSRATAGSRGITTAGATCRPPSTGRDGRPAHAPASSSSRALPPAASARSLAYDLVRHGLGPFGRDDGGARRRLRPDVRRVTAIPSALLSQRGGTSWDLGSTIGPTCPACDPANQGDLSELWRPLRGQPRRGSARAPVDDRTTARCARFFGDPSLGSLPRRCRSSSSRRPSRALAGKLAGLGSSSNVATYRIGGDSAYRHAVLVDQFILGSAQGPPGAPVARPTWRRERRGRPRRR